MIWGEVGEIVDFTIYHHPDVIWSGMLCYLRDRHHVCRLFEQYEEAEVNEQTSEQQRAKDDRSKTRCLPLVADK